MSFHPRMYASIRGFDPIGEMRSLVFDQMVIDYWRVEGHAGARGRYVSMHPRFVLILDDRRLYLARAEDAQPRPCAGCYIPAGLDIRGHLDEPGELRHIDIHLPLTRLKAMVGPEISLARPVVLPHLGPLAPLTRLLREECAGAQRSAPRAEALARAIMLEMFHLDSAGRMAGDDRDGWLGALRTHVFERVEHRISVDDLADLAGLSRTHFNRKFRSVTGQSPYRWVVRIKIGYAKRLLYQGVPCAEVANVTGFADQAHFSRSFKAETGQTPGLWTQAQAARRDGPILQDKSF